MIVDNAEGVQATESLIAWMKSQEIDPVDAIPILAAAIVVAVVSYGKQKKWSADQTYESVVLAGQCVVETYQAMKKSGKKKDEN